MLEFLNFDYKGFDEDYYEDGLSPGDFHPDTDDGQNGYLIMGEYKHHQMTLATIPDLRHIIEFVDEMQQYYEIPQDIWTDKALLDFLKGWRELSRKADYKTTRMIARVVEQ